MEVALTVWFAGRSCPDSQVWIRGDAASLTVLSPGLGVEKFLIEYFYHQTMSQTQAEQLAFSRRVKNVEVLVFRYIHFFITLL